MRYLFLYLSFFVFQAKAHISYIDQDYPLGIISNEDSVYIFDAKFSSFELSKDVKLKVRLSSFEVLNIKDHSVTGELSKVKAHLVLNHGRGNNLVINDFEGSMTLDQSRLDYSSLENVALSSFVMKSSQVFNSRLTHFFARNAVLMNVIFHQTYFRGVTFLGLKADNVKFLGSHLALNLRGCSLKDVEFNFENIEYLNLRDCRLQNVFVNGKAVTNSGILP